jgi:hypothetical protein
MAEELRKQFEKLGVEYYNKQGEVTIPVTDPGETISQIRAEIAAKNETMKVMNKMFNSDINNYVLEPMRNQRSIKER